ncbi:menaquinone-dependent protoporphyrinogen IX dehydrogenase [[Haemophilus] felis]|uniref:Protoporphyrinogen IX dehydrogenase [quinone] n=1 Tax=[Haemophilus] felis TaxID=123822 RepID=A0A1T0B046_9PAST|nr:menaquinone-dependent protoporphyrinogen IX dehydrogenase [[Haemophilus] felis]NBI40067.1 menaquinone-dependent protoporphyrinogen IX dehydrogenase [[Haemophilus] felis]NBI43024.1 menaquinone-dependent protoporphyrinogen IX dehydrogenase [[Haemophilus] felis]OOS03442.1 protoporphyrinogen oxidase [[Haemophilus] felis]
MKILILYSSREGQTKKISEFMANHFGSNVKVSPLDLTLDISDFDMLIIGASIRYGHFNSLLYQFVEKNAVLLNKKKTAFFGVNLTARKEGKDDPETNVYVRKFLQRVEWNPNFKAVFAGALFYPRYKIWDRLAIKLIMKITGGETDTSKEIEYTDWNKVKKFVDQLINH